MNRLDFEPLMTFFVSVETDFFSERASKVERRRKMAEKGGGGDFPDWPRHPSRPIVSAPDRPSIKMRLDKFSGGGRFLIS